MQGDVKWFNAVVDEKQTKDMSKGHEEGIWKDKRVPLCSSSPPQMKRFFKKFLFDFKIIAARRFLPGNVKLTETKLQAEYAAPIMAAELPNILRCVLVETK